MATATIGITRAIDELGRIVIPHEYRRQLRLEAGSELEVVRVGNTIRLRASSDGECLTCNGTGRA